MLETIGPKPSGKSLDRIDNDVGYVRGNLRWATPIEQNRNQQHIDAVVRELPAWLKPRTYRKRLSLGWSPEDARTVPVRRGAKRGRFVELNPDAYRYGRLAGNAGMNRAEKLLYRVVGAARRRCRDPQAAEYADYGGRGLVFGFGSVWEGCEYILRTLGPRPEGCSLDRIDNDVGYVRGNLRWATAVQQNTNKRGGLANKRKPNRAAAKAVPAKRKRWRQLELFSDGL